jgi:endonuclease YncB( thermonuclease family)
MPWPEIWPFNAFRRGDDETSTGEKIEKLKEEVRLTSWNDLTQPATIVSTVALTSGILLSSRVYKRYLRRIPTVKHIHPDALRKTSVFGKVTSVGDGDNFRMFHTPGGRLAGWGWLPGRTVPAQKADLKDQTLHIRIAGIDAPELAHFGRPAQPYGQEALDFLTSYILHKRVTTYIYRKDQYERVVGTVWVRKWGVRRDVGLEMLKRGLATVYEAKFGSEFGSREEEYRQAEQRARDRGIGMWKEPGVWQRLLGMKKTANESPREYKTRMKKLEKG